MDDKGENHHGKGGGHNASPANLWTFAMHYDNMPKPRKLKSHLGRRRLGENTARPKELSKGSESDLRFKMLMPTFQPVGNYETPSLTHPQTKANHQDSTLDNSYQMLDIQNFKPKENAPKCDSLPESQTEPKWLFQRKLFGNVPLRPLGNLQKVKEEIPESSESAKNETDSCVNDSLNFSKKTDGTVNSSTSDVGNDSFFTAVVTHPEAQEKSIGFDCFSMKTPGKHFARLKISSSPIDPLAGIFEDDSEHPKPNKPISFNLLSSASKNEFNSCFPKAIEPSAFTPSQKHHFQSSNQEDKSDFPGINIITPQKDSIFKKPFASDSLKKLNFSEQKHFELQKNEIPFPAFKQPAAKIRPEVNAISRNLFQTPLTNQSNNFNGFPPFESTQKTSDGNSTPYTSTNTILNPKGESTVVYNPSQNHDAKLRTPHGMGQASNEHHIYVNNVPYKMLTLLGKGGSSQVYQVLGPQNNLLAIKCVNLASAEDSIANGYLNEIELLSKLQGCPCVIRMFDHEYVQETKTLYVVMEIGNIDFSKLIKSINETKKVSMPMIVYYWTEILHAVKAIHDQGIIHSDLKPANFLLVNGRLKLIDFGIASSLQEDMTSVLKDVTAGTFNYISPEAITTAGEGTGYKITYKSDIWSLGCILYNLLYGKTPFSHLTQTWAKLQAIADPNRKITYPDLETKVPLTLMLSLRLCLLKNPKARPTASELIRISEYSPFSEKSLGKYIRQSMCEHLIQELPNLSKTIAEVVQEISEEKRN